jgi:hypothetical protein
MVAAGDLKVTPGVREAALLDILHPGAIDAQGDVVLSLAGDRAGVATDTLAVVDDEAVVHSEDPRLP